MRPYLFIWACCLSVVIPLNVLGEEQADNRKTLSPYFFIETRDSSLDHFPLKSTNVEVAISGVIAEVTVHQSYANMGAVALNGSYIFPASIRAAVHGMKMTIGERVITARIKEKEEARKLFAEAKEQGKSSSLLEQHRPNVFSMEVANIRPGDSIDIELRYTELLVPQDNQYEFVYPTVVGPRYSNRPEEGSPPAEDWVKNPYLKNGSESRTTFSLTSTLSAGMAIQEIACPSHDTEITYASESQAKIELTPSASFAGDRDYILRYRLAGEQISSGLLLQEGEEENYFLMIAQPPERVEPEQVVSREYLFVVDVSGSMHGFPLDTAKKLMVELLTGLRPADRFNVLLFAGDSQVLAEHSVPADPDQIQQAMALVDSKNGGGGTELLKAMRRAYQLPRQEEVSRSMIVITDGYIDAERAIFEMIQQNLNHTNVFAFGIGSSVNRYLIEGMARSGQGEPFVITSPAEAGPVARRFADYVAQPVLTDIAVSFSGIEAYDLEPPAVPDLFAARPVVIFGKYRAGSAAGRVTLTGKNGTTPYRKEFSVAEGMADGQVRGLDYLWARSRIARLSDFKTGQAASEHRAEIVELGLTYSLLTAFTSFIAIDEVVRNPEKGAIDVKQPLPLPKGVSNLAVGAMKKVPEPELLYLVMFMLTGGLLRLATRWRNTRAAALRGCP